jgi:hypothetical protein
MRRGKYSLLIILPLLIFISCNTDTKVNKTFPAINELTVGEKFLINLGEDHTKGESWKFDEDHHNKTVCEPVNQVWHGNEKGIYMHFVAKKPGIDTLNFAKNEYTEQTTFSRFIIQVK